jgi:hypothetical protein
MGPTGIYWAIWKARNGVCFEKKEYKNHREILYYVCAFVQY